MQLGTSTICACFSAAGAVARVRVSADERDRLDLFPGRQLRLGLPGIPLTHALVTGITAAPPFVWVEAEVPAGALDRLPASG